MGKTEQYPRLFVRTRMAKSVFERIFVPSKTNKAFTIADQVKMVESHNECENSMMKYVLKVNEARAFHAIGNTRTSFQQWLIHLKIEGTRPIIGVEVAHKNIVRVLFNKSIYERVEKVFGIEIAANLLNQDECKTSTTLFNRELAYSKKLQLRKISPDSNTAASQLSLKPKVKQVFGSYADAANNTTMHNQNAQNNQNQQENAEDLREQIKQLKEKHETYENSIEDRISSAINASQNENIDDETITQDDKGVKALTVRIEAVEKAQKSFEENVGTQISTGISQAIQDEILLLHNDFVEKAQLKDAAYDKKFEKMMETILGVQTATAAQVGNLTASFNTSIATSVQNAIGAYFTTNPPSGTYASSHGGDQCAWSNNNSVIAGTTTQSTISSTPKQPTVIHLTERLFDPPTRRTVYNPYKDEYISKRKEKKNTLRQMRIANGNDHYDDVWVGDTMDENKDRNIVRLWMQNVNGLVYNNDFHELHHEIANLADKNINYFSFTETCVNYNRPEYYNQIKDAFSQILPNGRLQLTNTPNYPATTTYQQGGVAGGFDGTVRERFLREGANQCGRWTWQEFGDSNCNKRIYTFYRVINGSIESSRSTTAWTQQKLYCEKNKKDGNPRKLAIDELLSEIKGLISNGFNIIVNGNFNEGMVSLEKLNEKMEIIGLYSLMAHHLDSRELPRTFNRGKNAIDHVYVTRHILENTHRARFAPFDEGFITDHRGLFFDLHENLLFPNDSENSNRMTPNESEST